jgi:hypothetical protein
MDREKKLNNETTEPFYTRSDPWPRSSYKLNLILQKLKEYLKENGMTIERQRNLVKINNLTVAHFP